MNGRVNSLLARLDTAVARPSIFIPLMSPDTQIESLTDLLASENYLIKEGIENVFKAYRDLLPLTKLAVEEEQHDLLATHKEYFARLHAIKLAILFGSFKYAVMYLTHFEKAMSKAPRFMLIHDACLFTLPKGKVWDIPKWQQILKNNMPNKPSDKVMRVVTFAPEIEQFTKEKGFSLTNKININKLLEYRALVSFKYASEDPEAAKLFLEHGISEETFDEYLALKKDISEKDDIPEVSISGEEISPDYKRFSIEKLPKKDPRAAILGKMTSCCQSLGDAGLAPTIYGLTSPNAGFYVLYEKKGLEKIIVAQCLAWKSEEGCIVFDSVESQINFGEKEKLLITDFFTYLANRLVQNKSAPRILVGASGQTPNGLGSMSPLTSSTPKHYYGYRDSKTQRIIADENRLIVLDHQYRIRHPGTKLPALSSGSENKLPLEELKEIYAMFYMLDSEYGVENLKNFTKSSEDNEKLISFKKELINIQGYLENATWAYEKAGSEYWDKIKICIEAGVPVSMGYKIIQGWTVLHVAVGQNDINMVKWLLEKGANLNVRGNDLMLPLHLAASMGHLEIALLLINKGAKIDADNDVRETALQVSVIRKQWDIANVLINHGANVRTVNGSGCTVLHSAAFSGNLDLVKRLIERGADLLAIDKKGHSAIHFAVLGGSGAVLQYFLETLKFDPNIKIDGCHLDAGMTPLHYAVQLGQLDLVELLITYGARVNDKDKSGRTAIHFIARQPDKYNPAVLAYLLKCGADIHATTNDGEAAIHLAVGYRRDDLRQRVALIASLIGLGLAVVKNKSGDTVFDLIAKYWGFSDAGARQSILQLIGKDNISPTDLTFKLAKKELLVEAIQEGFLNVVVLFITDQESANKKLKWNKPLNIAIEAGQLEIVKYLISKGAEWSLGSHYDSALIVAMRSGQLTVFEYFLSQGAYLNVQFLGQPGGYFVNEELYLFIKKIPANRLINYILDANSKGKIPMDLALEERLILLLIKLVDIIPSKDIFEQHPGFVCRFSQAFLFIAIQNGHLDEVKYLVEENKVDIEAYSRQYGSSILLLIYQKRIDIDLVRYLFERGLKIDSLCISKDEMLPLLFDQGVQARVDLDIQLLLIEQGASIESLTEKQKQSLLCHAAFLGVLDVVVHLVSLGAAPGAIDESGRTALDHAKAAGREEVVAYLSANQSMRPGSSC